jgi:hypothetical protein
VPASVTSPAPAGFVIVSSAVELVRLIEPSAIVYGIVIRAV